MSNYMIGVSAKEITPSTDLIESGRTYLWGFGFRNSPSDGVRDPIWTRALAVCDGEATCVVLVSLDVAALDPAFTERVRTRVTESRGIPGEYVAITVTHTHSAPVTVAIPTSNPGFDKPDPNYMAFLEDQVVTSIEQALDGSQPGNLGFARGTTNIGVNRHFGAGGAYDPTLDMLRATDRDGNVIAVAFFHGCHPIFLSGSEISSDYPGLARDVVEKSVGGVAIFFQGYGGTIDPIGSDMQLTGQTLGNDVVNLANNAMYDLEGPIDALSLGVDIPFQTLDPLALEQAKAQRDFNLKRWANYIDSLGDAAPDVLPTELQGIRVGLPPNQWRLAASSHEVVAEFSDPIRAIWPNQHVTLMGYSNGQISYLPNSVVLASPPCQFPLECCTPGDPHANYEGRCAFAWYGHRAPITAEVDDLFIGRNGWLNGIGVHYATLWETSDGAPWEARHGISRNEFQTAFDTLTEQGYRMVSWCGYRVAGEDRYAAVWVQRQGPPWQAYYLLSANEFQDKFDELVGQGYRLVQVYGYTAAKEELYAGIWEMGPGPDWQARHGLTADDYQQTSDGLIDQGYRPVFVSAFEIDGEDRYCGIWEQSEGPAREARHGLTADEFQQRFDELVAQGYRLVHIWGYTLGNEDRYAAIWEQSEGPAWEARHGLTACAHQRTFNQLAEQGYQPVVVTGYRAGG